MKTRMPVSRRSLVGLAVIGLLMWSLLIWIVVTVWQWALS